MVEKQKEPQEPTFKEEFDNMVSMMDLETLRRRQIIFDQIKERQQQQHSDNSKTGNTYKSVVVEEEFNYEFNLLFSIIKKVLESERKLKPRIRERPIRNIEQTKDCSIIVHVVKAENVPIRYELIKQYQNQLNEAGAD